MSVFKMMFFELKFLSFLCSYVFSAYLMCFLYR